MEFADMMKDMKPEDVDKYDEDERPNVPLAEFVTIHPDGSRSKRYMKFTTLGDLVKPKQRIRE